MEKVVQVTQQGALSERSYTDRNGMNQVFASMGFTLSDGIDTFYAEMQGDLARAMKNVRFEQGRLYRAQMLITLREFKDREGNTRYSNEIRIIKIGQGRWRSMDFNTNDHELTTNFIMNFF